MRRLRALVTGAARGLGEAIAESPPEGVDSRLDLVWSPSLSVSVSLISMVGLCWVSRSHLGSTLISSAASRASPSDRVEVIPDALKVSTQGMRSL